MLNALEQFRLNKALYKILLLLYIIIIIIIIIIQKIDYTFLCC